jgi:N-acetylglucosamine-6-phosphate deacetylase
MPTPVTVFTNGTIITPFRLIENGTVVIEGERIKAVGSKEEIPIPAHAKIINVSGDFISPGFIDLHLHGAWGGDVMSASLEDLSKMSRGLVRNGVTAFLPTTLTGPLSDIENALNCIQHAQTHGFCHGAKILGAHLEGPFINREQKGAQNPQYIVKPNKEVYIPLLEKHPCIVRLSAAPEVPGSLELGQELKKRKIVASIAHSNATYTEVLKAIEAGYSHVTHMFSSMSGIQRINAYRIAGVIESTLLLDELTTEMIADGHHLPPSLMKLVLKTKGNDKVCLVTDAMSAAGLGPGRFKLGKTEVIIEDNVPECFEVSGRDTFCVAKTTDRSSFASSVTTMDKMVKNMINLLGLNIIQSIQLVTVNPARMQMLDDEIGILSPGMKADLTVFNKQIDVQLTMVDGKIVFQNTKQNR